MCFLYRCLLPALLVLSCLANYAVAGPVVLFDEAHNQQFLIANNGPLDLSDLAKEFVQSGCVVRTTSDPLSKESLMGVDVLVISGAFQSLSDDEVEAVLEYVSAGGGLAVMLHIAPPVKSLLHRLEVDFTNGSLREMRHVIGDNPLNFEITVLEDHPLTVGLENFSVYGSWALRGTADYSKVVAHTSDHAWVDLDRNGQLSPGDAAQQFGVVVAGETGKGRFAIFGDDALFQNRFLDENNRKLANNLVGWLAGK